MNKLQKVETITLLICIISVIVVGYSSLAGWATRAEFYNQLLSISLTCLILSSAVFVGAYIIKIVNEPSVKQKLLWIVFPILAIGYSAFYMNGMWNFDKEFVAFNILSVMLGLIMVLLYNVYVLFYCGKESKAFITLLFYNMVSVIVAIRSIGIAYVLNYYLMFLIGAMICANIEAMIVHKVKLSERMKHKENGGVHSE